MNLKNSAFITLWGRTLSVACVVFVAGSLLIAGLVDHVYLTKDVFYCWLLVFFNAYIGTFITNQALKCRHTGFLVWAFLINGLRIVGFLILLLSIVKLSVVHERGFVLMTFFGYFTFLAAEVYGLHNHTKRVSQEPHCGIKDD
jgi:hypothetical protein